MKQSKILQVTSLGFLCFLWLNSTGCERNTPPGNPIEDGTKYLLSKGSKGISGDEVEFVPVVTPESKRPYHGKKPADLTNAERMALEQELKQISKAQVAIRIIATLQPQWQDADTKIKSILQSVDKSPFLGTIEQFAGSLMLKRLLADNDGSPEKREAISFYTKMLLSHNHPDSDLIGQALVFLEGYWSEEEIARRALETTKNARQYLLENPCQPCLESTGVKEKLLDARERKLYKMQQALSVLEKKAKAKSGS